MYYILDVVVVSSIDDLLMYGIMVFILFQPDLQGQHPEIQSRKTREGTEEYDQHRRVHLNFPLCIDNRFRMEACDDSGDYKYEKGHRNPGDNGVCRG